MAPDSEDCETARLNAKVPQRGRKILPDKKVPATAWTENDYEPKTGSSPGENRRLLSSRLLPSKLPFKHKSRLQAGLTLGVQPPAKYTRCPQIDTLKMISKNEAQKAWEQRAALFKPPYFILTMICIIVLVHMWCTSGVRLWLEWSPDIWHREPWRLFTYGLLHASVPHLILNALVALSIGWILEREQSFWRMVCLWCGGLVGGALGAGVLQPNVRVVGASAAVYALLTAHVANVCLRYGHIQLWWFRPLSVFVLGTSELCWALMRPPPPFEGHAAAQPHSSYEYIAWGAHVMGAAVGIPIGFLVFTGENYNKPHIVACRVVSVLLLIAGGTFAAIHYICYGECNNLPPFGVKYDT